MGMVKAETKHKTAHLEKILKSAKLGKYKSVLDKYGAIGVRALAEATPVRSGKTASSWYYKIKKTSGGSQIVWSNSNINEGVNIAVIIQYGHGTRNGGYVQGIDYINPSLRPVFKQIARDVWEAASNG